MKDSDAPLFDDLSTERRQCMFLAVIIMKSVLAVVLKHSSQYNSLT